MPKKAKPSPKAKIEEKKPIMPKGMDEKSSYYQSVGRRKESSARVRLIVSPAQITVNGKVYKKGDMVINGRPVEKYFAGILNEKIYNEPFKATENLGRFITTVKVAGGGLTGQLEAIVHGIARSLEKVDKQKYRPILKKAGFLTRDPRKKERRKAGFAQKARAKKQSPKR